MPATIVDPADLPRRVEVIDNLWIPMPDGCRLAAHVWLPHDAARNPVPAILEYIPYRKRDGTASRDAEIHPYVAAHGYACLRVDMRGNGDSDGIMRDEYLPQEQDDAVAVIAWIAEQPWCTGSVGMMGKSWGGFNALQVAARNPPALQAVVTVCSTDDRYADDIHYRGGALLLENFGWSSTMLAYSSRPPDPAIVGERWLELWLQRLENLPLLAETWLAHPLRDAYWRHGSVCEDFKAVRAPVLAVGGWLDGYSNAVPRLLRGLHAPVWGIVGPWVHQYPHQAVPEPVIGFLQECVRWWDRWLKDRVVDAWDHVPPLRAYVQTDAQPGAQSNHQAGEWQGFAEWPPADVQTRRWFLLANALQQDTPPETAVRFSSTQDTGAACGEFFPMQCGVDVAGDQRSDDERSLCFDSAPLSGPLTIAGAPAVHLQLRCDCSHANLIARLCEVAPDGTSVRVTYAIRNLTHATDHASADPLQPGKTYGVALRMDDIAHTFAAGSRLRLALSTAYWPMVWPPAQISTLTLISGAGTCVDLPVLTQAGTAVAFPPAEIPPPLARQELRAPHQGREVSFDAATGMAQIELVNDSGSYRISRHGLAFSETSRETYRIDPHDPLSAHVHSHWTEELWRDDWSVRIETRCTQTADATHFHLHAELDAFAGAEKVFEKVWRRRVPRHHN